VRRRESREIEGGRERESFSLYTPILTLIAIPRDELFVGQLGWQAFDVLVALRLSTRKVPDSPVRFKRVVLELVRQGDIVIA
jgi:hypothetical protein